VGDQLGQQRREGGRSRPRQQFIGGDRVVEDDPERHHQDPPDQPRTSPASPRQVERAFPRLTGERSRRNGVVTARRVLFRPNQVGHAAPLPRGSAPKPPGSHGREISRLRSSAGDRSGKNSINFQAQAKPRRRDTFASRRRGPFTYSREGKDNLNLERPSL